MPLEDVGLLPLLEEGAIPEVIEQLLHGDGRVGPELDLLARLDPAVDLLALRSDDGLLVVDPQAHDAVLERVDRTRIAGRLAEVEVFLDGVLARFLPESFQAFTRGREVRPCLELDLEHRTPREEYTPGRATSSA